MGRRPNPTLNIEDCVMGPLLTKEEEFSLSWEEKTELMAKRARKRQRYYEDKVKHLSKELAGSA